jgi:hypothetical protein
LSQHEPDFGVEIGDFRNPINAPGCGARGSGNAIADRPNDWAAPRMSIRHCEEHKATKQSSPLKALDCFAEAVIGPREAGTCWLATTLSSNRRYFTSFVPVIRSRLPK